MGQARDDKKHLFVKAQVSLAENKMDCEWVRQGQNLRLLFMIGGDRSHHCLTKRPDTSFSLLATDCFISSNRLSNVAS